MLKVQNISLTLGGLRILYDISFEVKQGEIIGLIGPNGAGKSSFFNVLSGMLVPDTGSIIYNHNEIIGQPPHKVSGLGISRTFQDSRLYSQMTVLENLVASAEQSKNVNLFKVFFDGRSLKKNKTRIQNDAMALLESVNIGDKAHLLASDLSYGQSKLVEMLKVLMSKPRLVLLDEPFSGLFPEMIKVISKIIRDMVESGITIMIVEHNMKLISEITDRVVVLDSGMKIGEGRFEEVKKDPKVLEAYLGN